MYRCKDCGNTDDFYGFGFVSITVRFNQYGEAVGHDEICIKGNGAEVEYCGRCDSANIEKLD